MPLAVKLKAVRVVSSRETARKARRMLAKSISKTIVEEVNKARSKGNFKKVVSLYLQHWKGTRAAEVYLTALILNGKRAFVRANEEKLLEAINMLKEKNASSASRILYALRQFQ